MDEDYAISMAYLVRDGKLDLPTLLDLFKRVIAELEENKRKVRRCEDRR
jgi:hypothetical protein